MMRFQNMAILFQRSALIYYMYVYNIYVDFSTRFSDSDQSNQVKFNISQDDDYLVNQR